MKYKYALSFWFLLLGLWLLFLPLVRGNTNEPDMQGTYALFNRTHFFGKLPVVPIRWENLEDYGMLGYTLLTTEGKPIEIVLDTSLRDRPGKAYQDMVLLHEMVHVWGAVNNPACHGHGKCFQNRMKMLALSDAFEELW